MNNNLPSMPTRTSRLALEGQKGATQKAVKSRLRFMIFAVFSLYCIIGARLYFVTMMADVKEPVLEAYLDKNQVAGSLAYGRADIIDRNGLLLATSLPVSSLYADPSLIKDAAAVAKDLAPILDGVSVASLTADLSRKGRFVWIKRGITPAQHEQINALGYPALAFQRETRRFYPHGSLFAHLIGSANIDGHGQSGLEYAHDKTLSQGLETLNTTFDTRIQYAASKALYRAINKFNAIGGIALVADIKTGELLAGVSAPDFDPQFFGSAHANEAFNRITGGVYEMGSTFKIFSTAAYLRSSGKSVSDIFDTSEPLRIGRFTIQDYHPEKRKMSIADIFLHSSNIGTALMARDIGSDALKAAFHELGFMSAVNGDAFRTATPLLPTTWREVNTLTASYGHGIAVTPIHLMNAFLTTIGGGNIKHVHILRKGQPASTQPIETQFLDSATSNIMQRLLRLGVTHGTGQFADLEGYQIGGKTGTAEKIGNKGYNEDRLISSFLGAFPMSDPQYAILVMVDEPKGRKDTYGYATGGWVAAPAVREIVADMAAILAIPPVPDAKAADEALIQPFLPYIKDKDPKNTAQILRRGHEDIMLPRFIDFKDGD